MKNQKGGWFPLFKTAAKQWQDEIQAPSEALSPYDLYDFGLGSQSVSSALQINGMPVRSRQQIYQKWSEMASTSFVSTSIKLQVTAALGGHETTGDLVFIECNPKFEKDKQHLKIVETLQNDLSELFNTIAFQVAFTGAAFGDSYARLYTEKKRGIVDLYCDELVHPALVVPFEKGSASVGYILTTGDSAGITRLTAMQMARMKMPRVGFVPQDAMYIKAMKQRISEDDHSVLPLVPGSVGGSLLISAEQPFNDLVSSITGLVGQRVLDSIDEEILTLNMDSMTRDQQKLFLNSVISMVQRSKEVAAKQVQDRKPLLERIRHIIPTRGEKGLQAIQRSDGGQAGRNGNYSLEDILFHARSLAGALGTDLSMLGFADLLAGGLGEGGFFRTSAQTAERSRIIRSALADFFDNLCNQHLLLKHGFIVPPSERSWRINFYGSISALESEKQQSMTNSANGTLMITQVLQGLKDLGANEDMAVMMLRDRIGMDEDQARMLGKIMSIKTDESGSAAGGAF
jgi:hypothetical protein